MLYKGFDDILGTCGLSEEDLQGLITEIVEISEYSREFPISLWTSGDETSKAFLEEWLQPLPPQEQIEHLLRLPHFRRMDTERLSYGFTSEEQALKRFRNELASFNKRSKLKAKNNQREKSKEAEQVGDGDAEPVA